MDKYDIYYDILKHNLYSINTSISKHCNNDKNNKFVSESKIQIIGIYEYKPYNLFEITKFRNLFSK